MDLYSPIEPYQSGTLVLEDNIPDSAGHVMYWEVSGNPDGVPVVFLHGGPGAGAGAISRQFFDPQFYRIIIFDQRGAGRSAPLGEVRENTTAHLIADMEVLRQHLGVESWIVFGGSWGSTLALAYGQAHPARCRGFILRGIFLCRPCEIDWFLYGMKAFFPQEWEAFAGFLPKGRRNDLLASYSRCLFDDDPRVHLPAARAWSLYEGRCSTLLPSPQTVDSFSKDTLALGLARIEAHYFAHNIFMPDNGLMDQMTRIDHLPCVIVQGRYDMVCPIASADLLANAWPKARYEIIEAAGHSAMEPEICAALVKATQEMKEL